MQAYPWHTDRIAQLVEQETFNLQVVGSIPTPVMRHCVSDGAKASTPDDRSAEYDDGARKAGPVVVSI
jgi:hypothetical protein